MVPELGAFLTQMKSANIHGHTNAFYPPSKAISFNEKVLTNDGLLVSYMADAEKIAYEEMLKQVIEVVNDWKNRLQKGERLDLATIGELWLNTDHKIQFQPHYDINYLTPSFGLSSFVSAPVTREVLKEEVVTLEEDTPLIITPEKRQLSSFRPYLKYAAVILLAFSTGLSGLHFHYETINQKQLVDQKVTEEVSKHIQEATFFNMKPLKFPSISLHAKKENIRTHHIVAGVFRIKKNADRKIHLLKEQGYTDAAYIGTNSFGLHQVSYDSYTDTNEALSSLKKIKQTHSADAWMLSK